MGPQVIQGVGGGCVSCMEAAEAPSQQLHQLVGPARHPEYGSQALGERQSDFSQKSGGYDTLILEVINSFNR